MERSTENAQDEGQEENWGLTGSEIRNGNGMDER